MVVRRPVVSVSGLRTELPPGDTITGAAPGTIVSGSGVAVDGAGNLGAVVELDVAIAPNPSGLIIVGNKLANDGSALRTGQTALASGNQALEIAEYALASGNAAISVSATALASGNAALVDIAAVPAGAVQTFTASSVIQAGNPVGLDDLGKARVITSVTDTNSRSFGSAVVFESAESTFVRSTYDSTNNKVVIAYSDGGNSAYGTAVVGTVSGTSISFGTVVVFDSVNCANIDLTYDSTNERVVIAYTDNSTSYGTAIVGTVSGTSISFGTKVVFEADATYEQMSIIFDSTNNKVVIAYKDNANSNYGTSIVGTVSGTSISFGTAEVFESALIRQISAVYDSTNERVVIAYADRGNSDYGTAIVGTVSGTSITYGTAVVFESALTSYISSIHDSTNNKVVITYSDGGNSYHGTAIVGTVSGTSISFGTAVVFESAETYYLTATYDSTNNQVVIAYKDDGNSGYCTSIVGTVSGTSISFGTAFVIVSNSTFTTGIYSTYDSTNNKVVIVYGDLANGTYGTAVVGGPATSTFPTISSRNNFIGISQSTVASGVAVSVRLPGSPDQNNTGLLAGSGYYVDPTTSGFTTTSTQPASWSGAVNWGVIGRAVNSTTLLLTDML